MPDVCGCWGMQAGQCALWSQGRHKPPKRLCSHPAPSCCMGANRNPLLSCPHLHAPAPSHMYAVAPPECPQPPEQILHIFTPKCYLPLPTQARAACSRPFCRTCSWIVAPWPLAALWPMCPRPPGCRTCPSETTSCSGCPWMKRSTNRWGGSIVDLIIAHPCRNAAWFNSTLRMKGKSPLLAWLNS